MQSIYIIRIIDNNPDYNGHIPVYEICASRSLNSLEKAEMDLIYEEHRKEPQWQVKDIIRHIENFLQQKNILVKQEFITKYDVYFDV